MGQELFMLDNSNSCASKFRKIYSRYFEGIFHLCFDSTPNPHFTTQITALNSLHPMDIPALSPWYFTDCQQRIVIFIFFSEVWNMKEYTQMKVRSDMRDLLE